ncbi:gamma-type small acid-soluble spore protein [Mangrovibacillus cuniculi]|uniref:Small, acid-soluble spore protein gamma-type n=1 Tax=Mangrovibacillus cuniculi TaxID=2593652 RepID=A0A7S8C9E1_9BACI|nr:gamma-type small acid-soluble spore protein [Mangrovibacillus cuniculi]QPC45783.1 gamma-type small acid-soluble spore protein [Mangrovibacillus cuniculi]
MENKYNQQQASATNAEKVKQQNAASAQGQYGAEFASQTDVQKVKQQNQQAEAKKAQNSAGQQNKY